METIDAAQEKLIDGYCEKFGLMGKRTPPSVLFHYTSADTFQKITQGRNLWLTHALSMNDAAEFSHGMTKFRDALKTLEMKTVDKGWLDRIREFFDREMKDPVAEPYVFSLTEQPDQLSQWRGYGDEARGVSIGFNSPELAVPMDCT